MTNTTTQKQTQTVTQNDFLFCKKCHTRPSKISGQCGRCNDADLKEWERKEKRKRAVEKYEAKCKSTNKIRLALADKVTRNGGYSRWNEPSYPLEFDVSLPCNMPDNFADFLAFANHADFIEHFEHAITLESLPILRKAFKLAYKEYDPNNAWDWIRDDMCESLDTHDGYNYIRPEIADRYKLKPDKHYNVKFGITGRGGKHLVIAEFEGVTLRGTSSDDLVKRLERKTPDDAYNEESRYANKWCNELSAFIDECKLQFSGESVESDFDYRLAFQICRLVENQWAEAERKIKQKAEKKARKAGVSE